MEEKMKGMSNVEQGNAPNYIGSIKVSMRLPLSHRPMERDQLLVSAVKEILKIGN